MTCDKLLQEADRFDLHTADFLPSLFSWRKKKQNNSFDWPIISVTKDIPHHGKNSLLPQGKSVRLQAGPYKEHEYIKNTQNIHVISSAQKASIATVLKKRKEKEKLPHSAIMPLRKIPRKETL